MLNREELLGLGSEVCLVVSDMDGTLLNEKKEITPYTAKVVKAYIESGRHFTICTGRIAPMAAFYVKALGIQTPVITANGAVVYDYQNKKAIQATPILPEEATALLNYCKLKRLDYSALTMAESYFSLDSLRIKKFEQYNQIAATHGEPPMKLQFFDEEFECIQRKDIYKILIYEPDPVCWQSTKEFIDALPGTGCTSSEPGLLDVSHRCVNKGLGLKGLTAYLQLEKKQVCAVGDYLNDLDMFPYAGMTVAMENGCTEIKQAALGVTRSNQMDGVAWWIENYLL